MPSPAPRRQAAALAVFVTLAGCARVPTPLAPSVGGSIGLPHRGVLTDGAALVDRDDAPWALLRANERRYGLPRFVRAIERAAARVAEQRPGAPLLVGDLSAPRGGPILPHFSHRSGRDADLLFYVTTLEGAPVRSPGFVHFGPDGLAWDPAGKRFLRFDVEREWLLVRALVTDEEARVQWLFVSRPVEAWLVEWARARGEPADVVLRAELAMAQPWPGGEHDDHVHVRTACAPEDVARGCEPSGPARSWLAPLDAGAREPPEELVAALLAPLAADADTDAPAASARAGRAAPSP